MPSSYTSSFSSSSYSASSRNAGGSHTYRSSEQHSGPQGTTVRTTTQDDGRPAVEVTRHFDPSGREVPAAADGSTRAQGRALGGAGNVRGRVEDVSDRETETDRTYRERMEDEYAKREGGA